MTDTAWLKEVCADPVLRPALSEPMIFSRDGKRFTVATDGHRMVELPGHLPGFRAVPPSALPSLLEIAVPTPDTAVPFDYGALKAFVESETKDVKRVCSHCESTGQVAYFTQKGAGPNYTTCPACKGACQESTRAYIGETLFNVRLFEPMLKNLPDERIVGWYQSGRRKPAIVDGLAWRFLVMPLNEEQIDHMVRATYHRFAIPGVKALAA